MRTMRKRAKVRPFWALLLTVVLAALALALFAGTALAAPPWSDASNSWWVSSYGLTDTQAGTVAGGYPDGTFKPALAVTRAQFAKMAVDGFGVGTSTPAVATFSDVPPSNYFFPWVEGGYDAGIIGGFGNGTFGPGMSISRQQADSILGLFLSQKELSLRGHIAGNQGNYASLSAWYAAEGATALASFADRASLATVHAPATAYLASHAVVQGSARSGGVYLDPGSSLGRSQAVALILRVEAVALPTALPTVSLLTPAFGLAAGGNSVVIAGTNFTGATAVRFGAFDATSYVVNSATQITAVAPAGTTGTIVDVTVTTAAGTSLIAGTGNDYAYGVPAPAPSAVHLALGSTAPVGGVTDVQIPLAGATDTHGAVMGWVATTAAKIKFTVTDVSPATSTITINGVAYTSGADYTILAATTLTIVVTTAETGKTTTVRTFTVTVNATATAPSAVHLAVGSTAPVGGVTDVQIPLPGATDTHGAVMGWVATTAAKIKFTVTDVSPATSTITINGLAYASGADYTILAATTLTIVVTTAETGKTTAVRTFTVTVAPATVVNIAAIPGVTAPVAGATPVTTIIATAQYTGTVTWSPANSPFLGAQVYTAFITLTAKPGFTLTGVAANFFTVAGATETNPASSGVVTAVFPATATVVNIAAIPGVTAPVTGATPVTTIIATAQYTGTVTWSPTDNPFLGAQVYTAFIALTAKPGFTLAGVAANFFTVAGATATNPASPGVVTAAFPATAPAVITLAAIPGVTAPVTGATPVTTIVATAQYTGTVAWSPTDNPFDDSTVYTATITLTAKPGFTLTGVAVNFFTVAGATATNLASSGVVMAAFPATAAPAVITLAAIPGVTAPVTGAIPVTTIIATAQYTGTVVWSPTDNPFLGTTIYTATITLTAKPGFTLTGVAVNFFTVAGAAATNSASSGVVTAAFPATT